MTDTAAQLTAASAPWWAVAAVAGGLSIVAGAVGGFISFWSLRKSDERHAGREELAYQRRIEERWDEDARRRVTDFIKDVRALRRTYHQLEELSLWINGRPPYPPVITPTFQITNTKGMALAPWKRVKNEWVSRKQLKACAALESRSQDIVTELVVIAPDQIVKQCRRVLHAAMVHNRAFSAGTDRSALQEAYDNESIALHRIIRRELRVRVDEDDPAF